jgi:dihydroxyacid dehydratase/phosphogluconate dehydratase
MYASGRMVFALVTSASPLLNLRMSEKTNRLRLVPEAQVGGPIALVQDGDIISVDAVKNTIELRVPSDELERRGRAWVAPPLKVQQGTLFKYVKTVTDASHGCITDV